jgi:hypothetical protein
VDSIKEDPMNITTQNPTEAIAFTLADEPRVWSGFGSGSLWNGWDVVAVSPKSRDGRDILALLDDSALFVHADGLVWLDGYCTSLTPSCAYQIRVAALD